MIKYLGSWIGLVGVLLSPLIVVFPIVFAASALAVEISAATIFLSVLCLSSSVLWLVFLFTKRDVLLAWGVFQEDHVTVIVPFQKKHVIVYSKCRSCGIGTYRHAFLNRQSSPLGTDVRFIYLSYDLFDEAYRNRINLWGPTEKRMKARFRRDLYLYLLEHLPPKQAQMLSGDYKKRSK